MPLIQFERVSLAYGHHPLLEEADFKGVAGLLESARAAESVLSIIVLFTQNFCLGCEFSRNLMRKIRSQSQGFAVNKST